jgi:hypothetical protein
MAPCVGALLFFGLIGPNAWLKLGLSGRRHEIEPRPHGRALAGEAVAHEFSLAFATQSWQKDLPQPETRSDSPL